GPAPSGVSQVDPPPLVEPLEISSESSGPAEGGDPAADDTAATCCSPRLETPPRFRLGRLRRLRNLLLWTLELRLLVLSLGVLRQRVLELDSHRSLTYLRRSRHGRFVSGSFGEAVLVVENGPAGAGAASPGGTAPAGGTRGAAGAGGAGATSPGGTAGAGGAGGSAGARGTGAGGTGGAGAAGHGGARTRGTGAIGAGGAAGAGGAGGATGAPGTRGAGGTTGARGPGAVGASGAADAGGAGGAAGAAGAGATGAGGAGAAGTALCIPFFYPQPQSSLPPPDSVLRQVLTFALVTKLVDFAARSPLDYVASLVTESESVCPPSVGGLLALGSDVLEDRQFELQCLAATLPRFASMQKKKTVLTKELL
ncbi:unnamed protein product, partial [Closterium sp. NIES-53]